MKIIDHQDAINRRIYEGLMIVETPIYEPARWGVPPVVATGVASLPLTEPYWDGINIYRWEKAFLQDDPH